MVIIAFSEKTSKLLPRIVCRKFRHCAPIILTQHGMIMYQFTAPGNITKININMDGIRRLRAHGWRFIYIPTDAPHDFASGKIFSCVGLSKRALRINSAWPQTPDGLFRYLNR